MCLKTVQQRMQKRCGKIWRITYIWKTTLFSYAKHRPTAGKYDQTAEEYFRINCHNPMMDRFFIWDNDFPLIWKMLLWLFICLQASHENWDLQKFKSCNKIFTPIWQIQIASVWKYVLFSSFKHFLSRFHNYHKVIDIVDGMVRFNYIANCNCMAHQMTCDGWTVNWQLQASTLRRFDTLKLPCLRNASTP